ncbi:MAG: hypothetical protein NZ108_08000 [Bacteroidia bacterium]|nr:hypothetical protein [Bacteroidia bacterium]
MNFKLKFLGLALVASGLVFTTGCKKDDEKMLDPTVGFLGGAGYVTSDFTSAPQTDVRVKISATKGADDKDQLTIAIQEIENGAASNTVGYPKTVNSGTFTLDTIFRTPVFFTCVNNQCNTYEIRVTVTGKEGRSKTASIKVTAVPPPAGPVAPKSFSGVIFNNVERFFRTSATPPANALNETSANAVASQIDLTYYYSSTATKHSLINPSVLKTSLYSGTGAYWASAPSGATVLRTTTLTSAQFDSVANQATLQAFYESGTDATYTGNAAGDRAELTGTGQILAFRNANGKFGIIRVKSLTSGNAGAELDIKVQN